VRGELVNDIARCIFCGTCEVKCPSQCIEVDRKAAVWTCDPFACVYCGVCVDTCPAKSLFQKTQYRSAADKRIMISMQGELKKKSKEKDKVKESEKEKPAPVEPPEPAAP